MPSLIIRDCRVVRLMPSLAAAPVGPPMTQLVSLRTRTICSLSAFARVAKPSKGASGATFVLCFNSASEICSSPPRERITPRSMKFSSSRTLPVTTALRKLGALAFGSSLESAYAETDVIFLQQVARQVAVAIDNALNFEQAQSVQTQLKEDRDRLRLMLEVNNAVVSVLDLHELLNAVAASLRHLVPHEYASLSLYDAESQTLQIHALDFPVSKGLLQEGLSVPVEGSPTGRAITTRQPVFITRSDIEQFGSDIAQRILGEGLKSAYCLPLISHGRPLGTLVVASLRDETFPQKDAELLQHIANQ